MIYVVNYSGSKNGALVNYSDEQSDMPCGLLNYSGALNQEQEN